MGRGKSRCAVYHKPQAVESLNGENRLMQIKEDEGLRVDPHQRFELLPTAWER